MCATKPGLCAINQDAQKAKTKQNTLLKEKYTTQRVVPRTGFEPVLPP